MEAELRKLVPNSILALEAGKHNIQYNLTIEKPGIIVMETSHDRFSLHCGSSSGGLYNSCDFSSWCVKCETPNYVPEYSVGSVRPKDWFYTYAYAKGSSIGKGKLSFTTDGLNSSLDSPGYVVLFESKYFKDWDNEAFFQLKADEPIEVHLKEISFVNLYEGRMKEYYELFNSVYF